MFQEILVVGSDPAWKELTDDKLCHFCPPGYKMSKFLTYPPWRAASAVNPWLNLSPVGGACCVYPCRLSILSLVPPPALPVFMWYGSVLLITEGSQWQWMQRLCDRRECAPFTDAILSLPTGWPTARSTWKRTPSPSQVGTQSVSNVLKLFWKYARCLTSQRLSWWTSSGVSNLGHTCFMAVGACWDL